MRMQHESDGEYIFAVDKSIQKLKAEISKIHQSTCISYTFRKTYPSIPYPEPGSSEGTPVIGVREVEVGTNVHDTNSDC